MATDFSSTDDIIDVRDVIARVEELRAERDECEDGTELLAEWNDANGDELRTLEALLSDLAGYGGDEEWEGNWYPVTLIHESHFVDAMRELCEDIGDVPGGFPAYIAIDWEKTADNLRVDYSSVTYDGQEFWYR